MSVPKSVPFFSSAVAEGVRHIASQILDPDLRTTFERCAVNTLETTVIFRDDPRDPDTFVLTGDIPAMWLRDSAAQVLPYLRFARQDERLALLLRGVIARHCRSILLDPYANAFLYDDSRPSEFVSDRTEMKPGVHERKYEIDSLAYPIRLAHGYWRATGDTEFLTDEWARAMRRVVDVWTAEQDHARNSPYLFERPGGFPSDTLVNDGKGPACAPCGLLWSGFRPSDDACAMPYHIPSNAMALVALSNLSALAQARGLDRLADDAFALGTRIYTALEQHGTVLHPDFGRIYAYEVDGKGGHVLMDDANIPSLLSLPYLTWCDATDTVYQRTRRFVLSPDNPCYVRGEQGAGVGSPHTDVHFRPGAVWPMSIIMQAMTSDDDAEIRECLGMLTRLHGGTHLMHESVLPDNPGVYSRAHFAWANSLFAELVFRLAEQRPYLLDTPPTDCRIIMISARA